MAITISGQNNNDKILASDGVLDQISGFNVVGVLTASTFETTGEITANHIDVGSNIQLGNAGIITATTLIGNVTGNVNSTSNLLLQISGSEKFRVGNGGQLGIGGANYGSAGQVLTSGGSGSAASWSTIASDKISEDDTEAEVYDAGSNTARFTVKTEGSERLRIDSDGNIGIGEVSPTHRLHVQGSGTEIARFEGANGARLKLRNSTNNIFLAYTDSSDIFQLGTNGQNVRVHVAVNGNVGLNETNPVQKLTVGGDGYFGFTTPNDAARQIIFNANRGSAGDTLANINWQWNSKNVAQIRGIAGADTTNKDDGHLVFYTSAANSLVERLRITNTGTVGIGTDNTDRQLAVFDSSQGTIEIKSSDTGQSSLWFSDISDGNVGGVYYTHSNNAMVLRTNDVDRLRIDSSGHMGLGVTPNGNWPTNNDFKALQIGTGIAVFGRGSGDEDRGGISANYYHTGSAEKYIGNGHAGRMYFEDGSIVFSNAAQNSSGANASMTLTERLRITSSGVIQTGSKTITGGNNLAIQNFAVKGVWSGASAIGKSIELISGYDSAVKMAAIGYNLTDVNLGSTYGGDLTFHTQPLYSSPTTPLPERMRISSAGYVTTPDTPAFIVRHSAAEVYSAGSYIDGPWTVTLNRGNHFNTSNGIFTAPVAGLYQFNCMQNNDYGSGSNPSGFRCHVNNSLYAGINFDQLDSHTGWFTHTLVGTLNLAANDTVRLHTSSQARVDNYNWNHWSMYLIG